MVLPHRAIRRDQIEGGYPMESLVHVLRGWLGSTVQAERSGPEACEGVLAAVCDDYLLLRSWEGFDLYLPLWHVRSVTRLAEPAPDFQPVDMAVSSFREVVRSHTGQQVRLYHAGPEVSVGELLECGDDHLLLRTSPEEVVCFALFHLRSLFPVPESLEGVPADANGEGW